MKLNEAIAELRKEEKRKFDQTVDLVISLRGVDVKRDNITVVASIPHKIKDKKVCGFLTAKNDLVKTITKPEFDKYKDKDALKELVDEYDFFIANAALMPAVATTFGKVLGPAGKMPSPQLGIITQETPEVIKPLIDRISKSAKIRIKELGVKVPAGKESMDDKQIAENIEAIYKEIVNGLPAKKENVKKAMIKLTMSKPIVVEM